MSEPNPHGYSGVREDAPMTYSLVVNLPDGWTIDGPHFKGPDTYLSHDSNNPEAAGPGYGWPLGSECWYFRIIGHGARLFGTGTTIEKACERVVRIVTAEDPWREEGAVSGSG